MPDDGYDLDESRRASAYVVVAVAVRALENALQLPSCTDRLMRCADSSPMAVSRVHWSRSLFPR